MRKTVLCYGELLWDLLPDGPELGGAPSNFAYRAHSLGHEAVIISRVGNDERGQKARRILSERGLDVYGIQEDSAQPTGTVEVNLSASGEPDFRIVPNVAYDHLEMTGQVEYAARKADCIYFGTLIQRSAASRSVLEAIFAIAPAAIRLLDLNLRKDCFDQEIVESSLGNARILKLNESEAGILAEMFGLPAGLPEFTNAVLREYPAIEVCIVTMGAAGVYARNSAGDTIRLAAPRVEVVDTCGSGDAFTAGFMHRHFEGAALADCCAYGNAFGAIVATTPGGTTPVSTGQVEQLAKTLLP